MPVLWCAYVSVRCLSLSWHARVCCEGEESHTTLKPLRKGVLLCDTYIPHRRLPLGLPAARDPIKNRYSTVRVRVLCCRHLHTTPSALNRFLHSNAVAAGSLIVGVSGGRAQCGSRSTTGCRGKAADACSATRTQGLTSPNRHLPRIALGPRR